MRVRLLFVFSLFSFLLFSQQLIINEVSQGPGSSEYVEFLVAGNPTCAQPVPCIDLRKVVFDDNNGFFASGSGTGIAGGAVRFADVPFWSCIPQGTLILIYNDGSTNPAIPSQDISLTDGNCSLTIPSSSNLLEKTTTSPTTTNSNYPPDVNWSSGGSWNPLAMSNTDDSFQIPNTNGGAPYHAVSWGNNTNGTIIYFSGSAAGKVFSMVNSVSNDWNLQTNWASGDIFVNETPGFPNSAQNQAWINSMNPYCGEGMSISAIVTNETCSGECDGTVSINVSNGQAPLTYLWSNGGSTSSLTNLCPGTYNVEVTGANGCSVSESIVIQPGVQIPMVSVQSAGPFLNTDQSMQLVGSPTGGQWSANCGNCINSNGIFSPQSSGIGSFTVCYEVGSGNCTAEECITIVVLEDCQPQITSETITVCEGDSVWIFNNWESAAGSYSQTFIDQNGCDSTHMIQMTYYQNEDQYQLINVCESDSVELFGQWFFNDTIVSQLNFSTEGCAFTTTFEVQFYSCEIEPFVIYIPNVFTPNNDQINDTFEIQILGGMIEEGYIFNRWGEIVHVFENGNNSWDGKDRRNGKLVSDGVYTYLIYYKPAESPRDKKHGFVTVIR
jgi:gliding motility-associated-like protein